jgi:hypothetical protein
MVRVGERQRMRIVDVGVPVAGERGQIAPDRAQQMVGVPGENPAVEERVAEIARKVPCEPSDERPGERDRQRGIGERRDERVARAGALVVLTH